MSRNGFDASRRPRRPEDPTYISAENNDPQKHIELLDECLKAILLIIPSQFAWPAIWHPNLHRGNIFVTNDTPHKLTGIIDWQFAGISPLLPPGKSAQGVSIQRLSCQTRREGTVQVILISQVLRPTCTRSVSCVHASITCNIPNVYVTLFTFPRSLTGNKWRIGAT